MWEAAKFQFLVAISIFVAIVPEGLPIILVTTLAIGMRNMARHKAIIRRMKAVETLGSTTVICTDKTGTLTKNQMTVRRLMLPEKTFGITGEGFLPEGTLTFDDKELSDDEMSNLQRDLGFRLAASCLSLCHNSQIAEVDGQWTAIGDPTDSACAVWVTKSMVLLQSLPKDTASMNSSLTQTERGCQLFMSMKVKIGFSLRVALVDSRSW